MDSNKETFEAAVALYEASLTHLNGSRQRCVNAAVALLEAFEGMGPKPISSELKSLVAHAGLNRGQAVRAREQRSERAEEIRSYIQPLANLIDESSKMRPPRVELGRIYLHYLQQCTPVCLFGLIQTFRLSESRDSWKATIRKVNRALDEKVAEAIGSMHHDSVAVVEPSQESQESQEPIEEEEEEERMGEEEFKRSRSASVEEDKSETKRSKTMGHSKSLSEGDEDEDEDEEGDEEENMMDDKTRKWKYASSEHGAKIFRPNGDEDVEFEWSEESPPRDVLEAFLKEMIQSLNDTGRFHMGVAPLSSNPNGPLSFRGGFKLIATMANSIEESKVYGGSWEREGQFAANRVAAYPECTLEELPATKALIEWACKKFNVELSSFHYVEINLYLPGYRMKRHMDGQPVDQLLVVKVPFGGSKLSDARLSVHLPDNKNAVAGVISGVRTYYVYGEGLPEMLHSHECVKKNGGGGIFSIVVRSLTGNNDKWYNGKCIQDMDEGAIKKLKVVNEAISKRQLDSLLPASKEVVVGHDSAALDAKLVQVLSDPFIRRILDPFTWRTKPEDPILPSELFLAVQGIRALIPRDSSNIPRDSSNNFLAPPGTTLIGTVNPSFLHFIGWHLPYVKSPTWHTKEYAVLSAFFRNVSCKTDTWESWCDGVDSDEEIRSGSDDEIRSGSDDEIRSGSDDEESGSIDDNDDVDARSFETIKTCWIQNPMGKDLIYSWIKPTKKLTLKSILQCGYFPVYLAGEYFHQKTICYAGKFKCMKTESKGLWVLVYLEALDIPDVIN